MIRSDHDPSAQLPIELLTQIFDHLPQPDVLRVAATCKLWRAVARQLSNYYQHVSYHFRSPHDARRIADHVAQVSISARAFLAHVRGFCALESTDRPRLSVAFRAVNADSTLWRDDFIEIILPLVLPALVLCMPIVERLLLVIDPLYWTEILKVLRLPTPHLQVLDIRLRHGAVFHPKPLKSPFESLPVGSLSRLTSVALSDIGHLLGEVDPLLSVRRVELTLAKSVVDLGRILQHFPAVRHLVIGMMWFNGTHRAAWDEGISAVVSKRFAALHSIELAVRIISTTDIVAHELCGEIIAACCPVASIQLGLFAVRKLPELDPLFAQFRGSADDNITRCYVFVDPLVPDGVLFDEDSAGNDTLEVRLLAMDSSRACTLNVTTSAMTELLQDIVRVIGDKGTKVRFWDGCLTNTLPGLR